jgi:hypothetical protein
VTERNLARRLTTTVVEALKTHGHILVAKGASETLARQLEDLAHASVERILPGLAPRLAPRAVIGEVTSTFGDEATDEAVEDMVDLIAQALMDSEHVEDVFAEDNVIRRDIFRAVRDALQAPTNHDDTDDDELEIAPISVRLDTLGYVAKAVAARADADTLRDALARVAEASESELAAYDASTHEATFLLPHAEPDSRIELEEAVADELAELVDLGFVDLPTIERRISLTRELDRDEQLALKPRVELVAARTLRRAGWGATWKIVSGSIVVVTFTPLAEADGLEVQERVDAFAAELAALTGAAAPHTATPPITSTKPTRSITEAKPPPAAAGAPAKRTPAAKRATPAAKAAPAKKAVAAKKAAPKRAAPPKKTASKVTTAAAPKKPLARKTASKR